MYYWNIMVFASLSGLSGYAVHVQDYGFATYFGLIAIGYALDKSKRATP
jgi:hypothetical protein